MTTQLKMWGNSQAIRIPREMTAAAGIHTNDDLNLEVRGQSIIITKVHRRLSLEERIAKYGPIVKTPEADWGTPVGRETAWEIPETRAESNGETKG